MTHDVALPYNKTPTFPPRCVVCETPNPGTIAELKIVVAAPSQGLAEDLADAALGTSNRFSGNTRITLKPPVCPQCKPGLKQYHFWKQIWQYLGPLTGVALFGLFAMKGLVLIGGVALTAGIVLPVAYELVYPPAVSATGMGRKINYEFRSQLCAQEFAELNQDEQSSS